MWILLLTKLPTEVSPPRGSIHWAGADAMDLGRAQKQKELSSDTDKTKYGTLTDEGDRYWDEVWNGYETKEDGAVWIIFDGEAIKVWPHEYSTPNEETINQCLMSADWSMSHFPMYGRTALFADPRTLIVKDRLDTYPRFDRDLYDAARIDGQDDLQAFYTAIGTLPLDLWFALGSHYAEKFGYSERDMDPKYKQAEIYEKIKSGWQEGVE